jgi:hypothetical protein
VVVLELGHPLAQDNVDVMEERREHETAQSFVSNPVTEKHLHNQHGDVDEPSSHN